MDNSHTDTDLVWDFTTDAGVDADDGIDADDGVVNYADDVAIRDFTAVVGVGVGVGVGVDFVNNDGIR